MKNIAIILSALISAFQLAASDSYEKSFDVTGFSKISANVVANIDFSQGNDYKATVHADITSDYVKNITMHVDKGTLFISNKDNKKEQEISYPRINIKIRAPHLNMLELKGLCNFNSSKIDTDTLNISTSGSNTLNLGKVNCTGISLLQKGISEINETAITCNGNVRIEDRGSSDIDKLKITANRIEVYSRGISNQELDFNCKTAKFTIKGSSIINGKIEADALEIDSSGIGQINLSQKGKDVTINNSGSIETDMKLDCENLSATNRGIGKIILKGTADKTQINNSGSSVIDTANLNKF